MVQSVLERGPIGLVRTELVTPETQGKVAGRMFPDNNLQELYVKLGSPKMSEASVIGSIGPVGCSANLSLSG